MCWSSSTTTAGAKKPSGVGSSGTAFWRLDRERRRHHVGRHARHLLGLDLDPARRLLEPLRPRNLIGRVHLAACEVGLDRVEVGLGRRQRIGLATAERRQDRGSRRRPSGLERLTHRHDPRRRRHGVAALEVGGEAVRLLSKLACHLGRTLERLPAVPEQVGQHPPVQLLDADG